MTTLTAIHWGVYHDDPEARAWAERTTHDAVLDSIRQAGRRTSGVIWRHYTPDTARTVLQAAVRAEVISAERRDQLLEMLELYAPALLITAEADFEPAQRFQA